MIKIIHWRLNMIKIIHVDNLGTSKEDYSSTFGLSADTWNFVTSHHPWPTEPRRSWFASSSYNHAGMPEWQRAPKSPTAADWPERGPSWQVDSA